MMTPALAIRKRRRCAPSCLALLLSTAIALSASAGLFDDALDHAVNWSVVSAFEARHLQRDQVWMPGSELCRPDFVVRAARVGILPCIGDVKRMAGYSRPHFFAEQPFQQVLIKGESVLRKDWIAEFLELVENLVI